MACHRSLIVARNALVALEIGLLVGAAPLRAQNIPDDSAGDIDIDPNAPLDPLPDLDIEWPSMGEAEQAGDSPEADRPTGAVGDSERAIAYDWSLEGLEIAEGAIVRQQFEALSALVEGKGEAVNRLQVDSRVRNDLELLEELLRSQGYYDARTDSELRRSDGRISIILTAEPGQLYHFSEVNLPGLDAAGDIAEVLRDSFGVRVGDPVVAANVIAAGVAIDIALGELGFAAATIGERQVVIDHDSQQAVLTLPVDPGPAARFGAILVSGEPPFPARHVWRLARFEEGDVFQQSKVDDLRRALVATGLIGAVTITPTPRDDGHAVDLAVELQPAPPRTIAGEAGYSTGQGLRSEISWQHRNLFNPEGSLKLLGILGTREQQAAVEFRRNNWRRRDQILTAQLAAGRTDVDAYEASYIGAGIGIERVTNFLWQKPWTWSLEAEVIQTKEEFLFEDLGFKIQDKFLIAALPAALRYDGSDDLLDPTTGFRVGLEISPEYSFELGSITVGDVIVEEGTNQRYLKAELGGSIYKPVGDRVVLAGRALVGSIFGGEIDNIAPSRRLYSGGGGSVRGYGYQLIGPRNLNNDPIGGRSLAEFSLEARVRLGDFGVVPFFDGGRLTRDHWPGFDDWQFGAGIGARYYSNFGPIRIDVGTPLNRRSGDPRITVTVSLGQAF